LWTNKNKKEECVQRIDICPVLNKIRYLSREVVVRNLAALREEMKI
jgi:hypothetical protein